MRKSIAKKISIPFLIISLVFTLIITSIGYLNLSKLVMHEEKDALRSNAIDLKRRLESLPLADDEQEAFLAEFNVQADGLCQAYGADYVSLYEPIEDGWILYHAIAHKEGARIGWEDGSMEPLIEYTLEPAELSVWTDETDADFIRWSNSFADELCVVVKVHGPGNMNYLMTVEKSYSEIRSSSLQTFAILCAMLLALFVLMTVVLYIILRITVSRPAKAISAAMEEFVVDGNRSQVRLQAERKDEFGVISQSFNKMADDIDEYVARISTLNSERDRQKTEIDIASKIQKGFLPTTRDLDSAMTIEAMMQPAKDVGGDMYDYIKLDDDHFYFMIADVSGKGISAALYMSSMLTYMRQLVRNCQDPSSILKAANYYLASNNPQMVFVTAFVGVYHADEHVLIYANAGHNPPYLLGKEVTKLNQKAGMVLGIFEDEDYENGCVPMNPGDVLFMYTDGVTEALNEQREFFDETRLEERLQAYKQGELLPQIEKDIHAFVGGQEQSDDITMLAVRLNKEQPIVLQGTLPEFERIRQKIMESELDDPCKMELCLAAEEVYANICSYAFSEDSVRRVTFSLETAEQIVMKFRDNGIPFNPTKKVMDEEALEEYDPETQEGGLGRFIVFSIADDVKYEYVGNENVLIISKLRRTET